MTPHKETKIRDFETLKNRIKCMTCSVVVAELFTAPIDTLKTNFQTKTYKSLKACAIHLWNEGGLLVFLKSSPIAVTNQICTTTSKYVLYKEFQERRNSCKNLFLDNAMDSLYANLITSAMFYPLDYIKVMIQRNQKIQPSTKLSLWRGFHFSAGKTFVGAFTFLPIYDYTNEKLKWPLASSFITSIISTTLMHPFDYMKLVRMTQTTASKNYFKGLIINYIRIVPHFTIMMTCFDYLK